MKIKLLCFFLSIVPSFLFQALCQEDNRPLTKAGGYRVRDHGKNGYVFSLEHEIMFKKSRAFVHGPRLDYYFAPPFGTRSSFFLGTKNLIPAYEIKFYPFYFIRHKTFKGPFIGFYACYFVPIDKEYKNGPGIGMPGGYQHVFKNGISLGFELNVFYMKNLNYSAIDRPNPNERYFYNFYSVKVGIKL